MTLILIIIGIGILGFNLYNTLTLRSILKKNPRIEELNDKKYWELKYSIQSLVTIFAVIAAVAGYLGINTLDDVKKSVSKELRPTVDSVSNQVKDVQLSFTKIKDSMRDLQTFLPEYQGQLDNLQRSSSEITHLQTFSKRELSTLRSNLAEINKKNKIQAGVYVVTSIEVHTDDPENPKNIVNFRTLITTSGDRLPEFSKPPTIVVAAGRGSLFFVSDVTTHSFKISASAYLPKPGEKDFPVISATILIIQNP